MSGYIETIKKLLVDLPQAEAKSEILTTLLSVQSEALKLQEENEKLKAELQKLDRLKATFEDVLVLVKHEDRREHAEEGVNIHPSNHAGLDPRCKEVSV